MKAIVYDRHGGADALELREVPPREPQAGEVVVRVHAAAINPVDWKIREGLLGQGPLPELTQDVINQINSFIETHISEQKLASPLAVIAPTGRITKKQLQARIQQWLESLSAQEDVLFSLKDF